MQTLLRMLWFLMLSVVILFEVAYSQSGSPGSVQDRLAAQLQTRQGLQSAAPLALVYPSLFSDLSVIGSNGFYYRATSMSRAAAPTVVPVGASKLEAYNLDPNSKG